MEDFNGEAKKFLIISIYRSVKSSHFRSLKSSHMKTFTCLFVKSSHLIGYEKVLKVTFFGSIWKIGARFLCSLEMMSYLYSIPLKPCADLLISDQSSPIFQKSSNALKPLWMHSWILQDQFSASAALKSTYKSIKSK